MLRHWVAEACAQAWHGHLPQRFSQGNKETANKSCGSFWMSVCR